MSYEDMSTISRSEQMQTYDEWREDYHWMPLINEAMARAAWNAATAAAVQFSRNAQDDAYVCGRNDEREAIAKWLEGQGQPGYAHEVRHR